MNGSEIVEALSQQLAKMEQRLNERLDRIEERLGKIEEGQKLLNKRIFETEQDVSLLKRAK